MTLGDYMKERGWDDEEVARRLGGCTAHAVKKWKYGERIPRREMVIKIEALTDGMVRPADFFASEAA